MQEAIENSAETALTEFARFLEYLYFKIIVIRIAIKSENIGIVGYFREKNQGGSIREIFEIDSC